MALPAARRCSNCGTSDQVSKRCSGCKLSWYCGRECQRAHWPSHKVLCGNGAAYHILCYGDSLTAGYHHGRKPTGPDHTVGLEFAPYATALQGALLCAGISAAVDHVGASGATAGELAAGLEAEWELDVANQPWCGLGALLGRQGNIQQYGLVIIMVGTNDLAELQSCSPDDVSSTIAARVRQLHECCHRHGAKTVAVAIPPNHFSETNTKYRDRWIAANAGLSRLAAELGSHVHERRLVECGVVYTPQGKYWELDGLHMTAAGYARLGELLAPAVRAALTPE